MAAGALLAVELFEPTPASAQTVGILFAERDPDSVKALIRYQSVDYSLTPTDCQGIATPATQGPVDGKTGSGASRLRHDLSTLCTWTVTMDAGPCRTIRVLLKEDDDKILQYAGPNPAAGDVKFEGRTVTFSVIPLDGVDLYFDVDPQVEDPNLGDLKKVRVLDYTFIAGPNCSTTPYFGLSNANQTNFVPIPATTTDIAPHFRTLLPYEVTNSSITITATTGTSPNQTTISKTLSGLSGRVFDSFSNPPNVMRLTYAAYIDYDDQDGCTRNGVTNQPCFLTNGTWRLKATHTEGSKTPSRLSRGHLHCCGGCRAHLVGEADCCVAC